MKNRKIHGRCNVWSVAERKISKDLMLMMGLNELGDLLAIVSSVCWYGCLLRRGDGHVL